MTALTPKTGAIFGKVQLACSVQDAIPAQHLVERFLGAAELHPEGLPPSAILCVRKWRWRPSAEDTLASGLGHFARHACRPAQAAVGAAANAVLFLDSAEMLACLALDWLSGTLSLNWWWCAFIRGRAAGEFLTKEWTSAPQIVPAALELLARNGKAVAFLQRIGPAVSIEILRSVLQCHAMEFSLPVSQLPVPSTPISRITVQCKQPVPYSPPEPWAEWVPEAVGPSLPVESRTLLGCGLLLRRASTIARSRAFQNKLSYWCAHQSASQAEPGKAPPVNDVTTPDPNPATYDATPRKALPSDETHPIASETAGPYTLPSTSTLAEPPSELQTAPKPTKLSASPATASSISFDPPSANSQSAAVAERKAAQPFSAPKTGVTPAATSFGEPFLAPGTSTETAFGGVLFLLNAAIALSYYADFTTPNTTGLELGIWDFLALLSSRFCGETEFGKDHLAPLLAQLAGRPTDQAPGVSFQPQGEGREEWLDRTTEEVTIYLRHVLHRQDAPEFLCRIPARIVCSYTHVDVFYSLQTHPIEIRIACLDRNPGWIPAAGRYVAFHFN